MAKQTPEERKRRFEEQRKMIDSLDVEDEMNATKSALSTIAKKERILSLSKERAASKGKSAERPRTAVSDAQPTGVNTAAREPS